MKKLLTVSLFAIMAVSTANADIASTKYVGDQMKLAEKVANKVTLFTDKLTDDQYPTAKLVVGELAKKQGTLKAGANITIGSDGTITAKDTTYSTGTAATSGLTKLYGEAGTNTDGTMTQNFLSAELKKKEITDNKVTSVNADVTQASDTKYPSEKAVRTAIDALNTNIQGQLNGKQASLGYTAENTANKVTTLSNTSTNTQYPGAKLVYDELAKKQGTLTAGANITISGNTISAKDTTYSTGTTTTSGLTKLYTTTGDKTDGTMTQSALTTELGKKEITDNKVTSVNLITTQASDTKYPSEKAVSTAIYAAIGGLSGDVSGLTTKVIDLESGADGFEKEISSIKQEQITQNNNIATNTGDISNIETNLGPLNGVEIAAAPEACRTGGTGRCALIMDAGAAKWEVISY